MQDRKMEEQIWGQARRWKMRDRKMGEQIWGQARRWKMQERKMEELICGQARRWKMWDWKMEDQKMEDRKLQDQVLCAENAGIMSVYPYEIYYKLNAPFTLIFNYRGVILI